MMSSLADGDALGRLWQNWTTLLVHELRSPWAVAQGYGKFLREHPELAELQRFRILSEQEKALRRMSDMLKAVSTCSRGRATELGHVFSDLEHVFGETLIVTRAGDLTLPPPTDHLGFVLWLLVHAARQSFRPVIIDVTVTDSGGRIRIAPDDASAPGAWKPIMTPDVGTWWFEEALETLTASNYAVEAYQNYQRWYITVAWTVCMAKC